MNDYEKKVAEQIAQYAQGYEELPPIFHYWSNKYLRPKLAQVFGTQSVPEFYANQFERLFKVSEFDRPLIVSVGSGDASNELLIARHLISRASPPFKIFALDLIPASVERANKSAEQAGLSHCVESRVFDVNTSEWDGAPITGVMAHHSLHHIQNLERTFAFFIEHMHDDGIFLTQDMIGRNGHMRWPETLRFVQSIWEKLPTERRYNFQLRQHNIEYQNADCSGQGFEGIRAQDILPLLIKFFSFEAFVGAGGIIDPFIDRGYGANFRPDDPGDRLFIDVVEAFNDELLAIGVIKPTMMFARMVKKNRGVGTLCYRDITPERSVRSTV